ncbi:hypothetical protein BH09BAC4_BH09BAC4_51640 [soil metagenome]
MAIGQTGVEHLSIPFIRDIDVPELAGVIGLLVPWYTQILPILTPIAARCLGLIIRPAYVIHYRRHEPQNVWLNVVILFLGRFVAYGHFT